VAAGSPADGTTIGELPCGENAWVSLVIRNGNLITVASDTRLQAGDDLLLLADPAAAPSLAHLFSPHPDPTQ
jgi:potassium/hydrogen antiporter